MKLFFGFVWFFQCLLTDFAQQKSDFNYNTEFSSLLYRKGGNVSIIGIFNHRFGRECDVEPDRGLEEIASAIWTVEALNNYNFLPGVTVGLEVVGVCENLNEWKNLSDILDERLRFDEDDNNSIGVLTTPEIRRNLKSSGNFLNRNILHVEHVITTDMLADATIQLLVNLQWRYVNVVVSDSADTLKSFRQKASEEGILMYDEILINNSSNSCVNFSGLGKPQRTSLVVVIAAFANVSTFSEKVLDEKIKLILTPTDFVFDSRLLGLPKDTIVSLPSTQSKAALSNYIKHAFQHKDFFSPKPPTKGPLFIGTAASILKLVQPIRRELEDLCRNAEQPCASAGDLMNAAGESNKTVLLSQKSMRISPDDVEETLKVLKIEPSSNDEMFLYISSTLNADVGEDLAIFQIFTAKTKRFQPVLIMINDDSLKSPDPAGHPDQNFRFDAEESQAMPHSGDPVVDLLQKFTGRSVESLKAPRERLKNMAPHDGPPKKDCAGPDDGNGSCPNSTANHVAGILINGTAENDSEVAWRFLTWVSINTSLGFVSVTCTLSTMLFVIIRLCKDDLLEGSPYFTLLLMTFVIFMYVSSLPFHVEFLPENWFICSYRKNGPPVVFAVLFSLLLSRSLVLAFSESGGEFGARVNGCLQFVLCFFMIGVQMSIIVQSWVFEKADVEFNCFDAYDKYKMIFTFGYDFFLLILLACVSPFIVRSKQNYKEGLLYSISVFFITVVWSVWISFYVLLPKEHKDVAVAFGLNLTASVLLICIFIPQTYLMSAPFDPERTFHSYLNRKISTDISNVNFKSGQALNESAFGTISYRNCEVGVTNPDFPTSLSNENSNPVRTDHFVRETVTDISPEGLKPN